MNLLLNWDKLDNACLMFFNSKTLYIYENTHNNLAAV